MNINLGTVVTAQGTTPGPASAITYTINVDQDGSVIRLAGIVPANRPYGSTIDIRAAKPGSLVLCCIRDQRTDYLVFGEEPDYAPCAGAGTSPIVMTEEMLLLGTGATVQGTNTGNEGVPGGGDQP